MALLHLISAIGAFYLYTFTNLFLSINLSFWAIIFHCTMYYLLFSAINTVEKGCRPLNKFTLSGNTYKLLFYILLISSIISFYDSILTLSTMNIFATADIGQRRFDLSMNNLKTTSNPLLGYIVGPSYIFNGLKIILFYLSFVTFKRYKKHGIIMLICSLTAVVQNLVVSGRNSIALWLFLMLINYVYFKPYLSDNFLKLFKTISFIFLPIIMLPTIIITIARFASSNEGIVSGLISSFDDIISYYSQGFINFSNFFNYFDQSRTFGKICFPLFFGSIDANRLNDNMFSNASFDINTFSTMIGSFLMDFGIIGTIILVLLHLFVAKILAKLMMKDKTILSLVILFMCFEVLSMGVFYFMNFSPMFQKVFFALVLVLFIKEKILKKKSDIGLITRSK